MLQLDLIKQFKTSGKRNVSEIVLQMNADTAVSLLFDQTKSVRHRLFKHKKSTGEILFIEKPYRYIINRLEREYNVNAFNKFVEFLFTRLDHPIYFKECTWKLWSTYAGHYSIVLLEQFCKYNKYLYEDLSLEFFNITIKHLPSHLKYFTHNSISEAFLQYEASDQDKINILNGLFGDANGSLDIDWYKSAKHFDCIPYQYIKQFLNNNKEICKAFSKLILKNKDLENAQKVLLTSHGWNSYCDEIELLLMMFNYNERIQIIKQLPWRIDHIENVIEPSNYEVFARDCMQNAALALYISKLPVECVINQVKAASVTARITDKQLYVNLSKELIEQMPKEELRILLTQVDQLSDDNILKYKIYNRFTRDELLEFIPDLTKHRDYIFLVKHMTPEEIVNACNFNKEFIKVNLSYIPNDYLLQYCNKDKFKELIGDRRNRVNKEFSTRLQAKIDAILLATRIAA